MITSPRVRVCSRIRTLWPAREQEMAAARPPSPAPTMMMSREIGEGISDIGSRRRKMDVAAKSK